MATTTPNYGWTVPTSGDLVKDGATAIETLGDAIDASMNTALGTKKAGMVLLSSVAFNGVASQSVSDVFSATYKKYRIVVIAQGTANFGLNFRLRVAGADNSTANYTFGSHYVDAIGGSAILYSQLNQTNAVLTQGWEFPATMSFDVMNPFSNSDRTLWTGTYTSTRPGTNPHLNTGYTGGFFNGTTSFTGFTLSGSTLTGSVSVYGYGE